MDKWRYTGEQDLLTFKQNGAVYLPHYFFSFIQLNKFNKLLLYIKYSSGSEEDKGLCLQGFCELFSFHDDSWYKETLILELEASETLLGSAHPQLHAVA